MKIIANLSQTYGNKRYKELDSFLSEENINALKLLNFITFSFHNCDEFFINFAKDKILQKIPNCIFYEFNNIDYCYSIIKYLHNLKNLGCTDYLLWQDDHYINNHNKTIILFKEVINYYKNNNNVNYLSLFSNTFYNYKNDDITIRDILNIKDNLNLYKLSTRDIFNKCDIYGREVNNNGTYAYSDENYICDIDFALKYFFNFKNKKLNVWDLEKILCDISKDNNLERWFTNAIIFYRNSYTTKNTINMNEGFIQYLNDQNYEDYNNNLLL